MMKTTNLSNASALAVVATVLSISFAFLAPLIPGVASASEDRVLFRYNGLDFDATDLSPKRQQQLFDAYQRYYDSVTAIVRDSVVDMHVSEQADASGREAEAVRKELLPVATVPAQAAKQFYDANRQRIGAPFEQVRVQIIEYLEGEQDKRAKSALVARLVADGKLKSGLPDPIAPQVQIAIDGFPSKGATDAPVTVVEFADYQCPHCRAAVPVVRDVLKKHAGKVRVVFVDFPINRSGISRVVAKGAFCAQEQGRFWDYHDLAFERQASLSKSSPTALAGQLGLDAARFEACLNAAAAEQRVARAESEAQRLGLSGTPTLYVNGRRLRVTRSLEGDLHGAVEQALKEAAK